MQKNNESVARCNARLAKCFKHYEDLRTKMEALQKESRKMRSKIDTMKKHMDVMANKERANNVERKQLVSAKVKKLELRRHKALDLAQLAPRKTKKPRKRVTVSDSVTSVPIPKIGQKTFKRQPRKRKRPT